MLHILPGICHLPRLFSILRPILLLVTVAWVLRVRPSPEEVEALVTSLGDFPNDERQVHFEMPINPSDAEISAMLDMLAEDSSDSVPAETIAVATIPEPGKTLNAQKSDGARPKRLRPASHPTAPAEGKKKKKRRL
jgi:hypothetical protein